MNNKIFRRSLILSKGIIYLLAISITLLAWADDVVQPVQEKSKSVTEEETTGSTSSSAPSVYLEGVTLLGKKKSAYLVIDDSKTTVNEGDTLGKWRVTRIEQRAVFLTNDKGIVKELPLHSRIALPATTDNPTTLPTETKGEGKASAEMIVPKETTYTRPTIPDDKVPPGHRKVSTPFGDFLVKEEDAKDLPKQPATPTGSEQVAPNSNNPLSTNKPVAPDNNAQVPPGHHKMNTPFGTFIVKDKE